MKHLFEFSQLQKILKETKKNYWKFKKKLVLKQIEAKNIKKLIDKENFKKKSLFSNFRQWKILWNYSDDGKLFILA